MRFCVLVGPGDDCSRHDLDGGRVIHVTRLRPDKDVRHADCRGYLGQLLAVSLVLQGYRDAQAPQCEPHNQEDTCNDYYDSVLHPAPPFWSPMARARSVLTQSTYLL